MVEQGMRVVSIPFKRERATQPPIAMSIRSFAKNCFHSLQTGARISTILHRRCQCSRDSGVSIPFKRERATQLTDGRGRFNASVVFPFPSNGSAHLNEASCERMGLTKRRVSIPFKRDSATQLKKFRTPNNTIIIVSIPFKRDSATQCIAFVALFLIGYHKSIEMSSFSES